MSHVPTDTRTIELINELHRQGVRRYVVLMRHAERPITTPEDDLKMQITEEGKRAAYAFGQALPAGLRHRFFASPVERCIETAEFIAQGVEDAGGAIGPVQVMDALYAPYIYDLPTVDGWIYDLYGRGEWAQFFRNWFDGGYPVEAIGPASEAADVLIKALLALLQSADQGGDICVSHDINVFLLKEIFLGLRPEDHEYIRFLEGVILYEQGGAYFITHHQAASPRSVPKAAFGNAD